MRIAQEFVEMRDAGKWLAIAKKWIIENGPCPKSEYFAGVRPLMPTHIRDTSTGKKASQISLCKQALIRFGIKGEVVQLDAKPPKPASNRDLLRARVRDCGYADLAFLSTMPNGSAVARQLWLGGEVAKIGRGLFCDPSRVDEFRKLFNTTESDGAK
jgi:hypothetical protein